MSQGEMRGTRAAAPDLDWSQVRETVLMLELAAGQVDAAMRDSNSSVDTLMDTFTSMADTLATIDVALGTLPELLQRYGHTRLEDLFLDIAGRDA